MRIFSILSFSHGPHRLAAAEPIFAVGSRSRSSGVRTSWSSSPQASQRDSQPDYTDPTCLLPSQVGHGFSSPGGGGGGAHIEELYNVQMDVRQVQAVQSNHAERLLRLEKRQQEDAAVKSVWSTSPFPTAIGGTPQHGERQTGMLPARFAGLTSPSTGPVHMPSHDMFDLDGHSQTLASLHLEPDDEPARRGAASRANSVRFDESANWAQSSRHSGEFGPIRPGSGLAMERSLSHKSDGRHSSAGHSVHSTHSAASGRGSSLGLDTHLMFGGQDDDSPLDIPDPPPGLFILGSVPAIIRCWLTSNFANDTLLYAAVCSGSQKSTVEHSLVRELGILNDVCRDVDGMQRIRLPVYLAEAIVSHSTSRSPNQIPQIPSMAATFEIVGADRPSNDDGSRKATVFSSAATHCERTTLISCSRGTK